MEVKIKFNQEQKNWTVIVDGVEHEVENVEISSSCKTDGQIIVCNARRISFGVKKGAKKAIIS